MKDKENGKKYARKSKEREEEEAEESARRVRNVERRMGRQNTGEGGKEMEGKEIKLKEERKM